MSVVMFYLIMPPAFKDSDEIQWKESGGAEGGYEMVGRREEDEDEELDLDEEIRKLEEMDGPRIGSEVEQGGSGSGKGAKGSKKKVSWGETEVLAGNTPRPSSSD